MAGFNKVVLLGNLTRDPELKYSQGGSAMCRFGLAVNRKYKKGEETVEEVCFVDCTAFGRTAEVVNEYASKGKQLLVEGRLELRQWEKDGVKHSRHQIAVEAVTLVGSRDGGEGGGKQEASKARPATARAAANAKADAEIDDSSIPF